MHNLAVWGSCPKRENSFCSDHVNVSCLAEDSLLGSWQLQYQRFPTSLQSGVWSQNYCSSSTAADAHSDTVVKWLYILNLPWILNNSCVHWVKCLVLLFSYFRITFYTVFGSLFVFFFFLIFLYHEQFCSAIFLSWYKHPL